jgi:hypothetical protein
MQECFLDENMVIHHGLQVQESKMVSCNYPAGCAELHYELFALWFDYSSQLVVLKMAGFGPNTSLVFPIPSALNLLALS